MKESPVVNFLICTTIIVTLLVIALSVNGTAGEGEFYPSSWAER